MHELTKLLEYQMERASLKHPETVGVVERSHSALKCFLKLNTIEQWKDWFKYVQLATFIHITSYHSAIGCRPKVLSHRREPTKPQDLLSNSTLIERIVNTFSHYRLQLTRNVLGQNSNCLKFTTNTVPIMTARRKPSRWLSSTVFYLTEV